MEQPIVKILDSGYTKFTWSSECWAQIPWGFTGDILPIEYVFNPGWNYESIQKWWASFRALNATP